MATEKYSFFNSEGDDRRRYNAFDFAAYFDDLYASGVVHKNDSVLKVSVKEGMSLKVADGSAFIMGYRYELGGGDMVLPVPLASGANRVDRVVLRLNLADRSVHLFVKPGTAAPPALTRSGTIWELSLARVTAKAGVSVITAADIVDERADASVCGWARTSTDPAFIPSNALPELLWRYTLFPDTLTAQERATAQGNAQLMAMFHAAKAMSDEKKATATEAIAGTDNTKWLTPSAFKGALQNFWDTRLVYGSYVGVDQNLSSNITLGFSPNALIIYQGSLTRMSDVCSGMALSGHPFYKDGNESYDPPTLQFKIDSTNSFTVFQLFNLPGKLYYYIAFR